MNRKNPEMSLGVDEIKSVERESSSELEQSRVIECSADLLRRRVMSGCPGHDQIFIMGQVRQEKGIWYVEITDGDPTVALSQKVNERFGLKLPLVNELRDDKTNNRSLVSGGSFVWLHQPGKALPELILLERDAGAPTDAGCLTGPAGRCGELPSQTSVAETNEELIIVKAKTPSGKKHYELLGFYRDEAEMADIVTSKLRQVQSRYDELMSLGQFKDAEPLKWIRGEDDVKLISMQNSKRKNSAFSDVVTNINGQTIDRINQAAVYFDSQNNTLEIREVVDVQIPENCEEVFIVDGELKFNRQVKRFNSTRDLKGQKLVPALANYARLNEEKVFSDN